MVTSGYDCHFQPVFILQGNYGLPTSYLLNIINWGQMKPVIMKLTEMTSLQKLMKRWEEVWSVRGNQRSEGNTVFFERYLCDE